jgi:hypothetical protein
LRQAIADARAGKTGAKPILVLINPPYAESESGVGKGGDNTIGVEKTRINVWMRELDLGFASKELFVQFLIRTREELPTAKLAIFNKLKYVNAPNFEKFRSLWKAKYLGGFMVHSRAFELKGEFPIGFLVWDQKVKMPIRDISTEALDRNGFLVAEETFRVHTKSQFFNA